MAKKGDGKNTSGRSRPSEKRERNSQDPGSSTASGSDPAKKTSKKPIRIALWGDIPVDVGFFMDESDTPDRLRYNQQPEGVVRSRPGGVHTLKSYIEHFLGQSGLKFSVNIARLHATEATWEQSTSTYSGTHLIAQWQRRSPTSDHWVITQPYAVGRVSPIPTDKLFEAEPCDFNDVDILVINFEGELAHLSRMPTGFDTLPRESYVVFKYRPGRSDAPHWPLWLFYWLQRRSARVICVTDAGALRDDDLIINTGRSWERTFQDLVTTRGRANRHQFRRIARHLAVMFETQGVLLRQRPSSDHDLFSRLDREPEKIDAGYGAYLEALKAKGPGHHLLHSGAWTVEDERKAWSEIRNLTPEILDSLTRERSKRYALIYKAASSDHIQASVSVRQPIVPSTMNLFTAYITSRLATTLTRDSTKGPDRADMNDLVSWSWAAMLLTNAAQSTGNSCLAGKWDPVALPRMPLTTLWSKDPHPDAALRDAVHACKDERGWRAMESADEWVESLSKFVNEMLCDGERQGTWWSGDGARAADRMSVFAPDKDFVAQILEQHKTYEHELNRVDTPLNPELDRFRNYQWSIAEYALGNSREDVFRLASNVLTKGDSAVEDLLADIPHFYVSAGNSEYFALRRHEVEGLRDVESRVVEFKARYLQKRVRFKSEGSLNILCFGDPGSGKTFATRLIVRENLGSELFGGEVYLNLSLVQSVEQMLKQLQKVRDVTITGRVPLVIVDEFDAARDDAELGWLPLFLSPMEEGTFLSDVLTQGLGSAIYLFVGSKFASADVFGRACRDSLLAEDKVDPDLMTALKLQKGRDFESRIDARLTIPGLNPASADDFVFILQRMLLLRSLLSDFSAMRDGSGGFKVSSQVLKALLLVPRYYHNARSMKKLVNSCSISTKRKFERSDLPSRGQLSAHVNAAEFLALAYRIDRGRS